jgi:methionyl aminopeptidase
MMHNAELDENVAMRTGAIKLHGPEGFAGMRKAGRIAAECLDMLAPHVKPGVETQALDRLARDFVLDHGALPACVGYRGYRHTTCISLNHVICHGIPSEKTLKDGDVLNIDVTVIVDGWHGDTSRMFYAGEPKVKARRLVETTHAAMMAGIEAIKPGATLYDIGKAIQTLAEREGFSVVRDFCGHGLGRVFHDAPNVVHYAEYRDRFAGVQRAPDTPLKPGMFFTVEPMINEGKPDAKVLADGWTAVTRDKSLSAQFEHSVGVTETGFEIFTASPKGLDKPPY